MRIAFVIQHIGALGGTERACTAILNALARSDACDGVHLFELRAIGAPRFALSPDVSVQSLFDRRVTLIGGWPAIAWRLRTALRAARIDTLVVVEATHALYAVPVARFLGIRVIVWEHFNFRVTMGKRKRALGRRIAARLAHDIVVLTKRDIALWTQGARPWARLTCIPNPAPAPSATAYGADRRLVLAAGRLAAQKGFERLLAAWAIACRDPAASGWRLEIRGDGPDRAALEAQAAGLVRAAILPASGDIEAAFAQAGIVAASSRFEGLPMVLLEAASHGVPAVAFDCETGPAEILLDGQSGLLVPEGDVAGLARALVALMGDDQARVTMAAAARARALSFSEAQVRARWLALLAQPG